MNFFCETRDRLVFVSVLNQTQNKEYLLFIEHSIHQAYTGFIEDQDIQIVKLETSQVEMFLFFCWDKSNPRAYIYRWQIQQILTGTINLIKFEWAFIAISKIIPFLFLYIWRWKSDSIKWPFLMIQFYFIFVVMELERVRWS